MPASSRAVLLEVKMLGTLQDSTIGQTEIKFGGKDFGVGKRQWHKLDKGGKVEVTTHTALPSY